jgi:hypothetical protein
MNNLSNIVTKSFLFLQSSFFMKNESGQPYQLPFGVEKLKIKKYYGDKSYITKLVFIIYLRKIFYGQVSSIFA